MATKVDLKNCMVEGALNGCIIPSSASMTVELGAAEASMRLAWVLYLKAKYRFPCTLELQGRAGIDTKTNLVT